MAESYIVRRGGAGSKANVFLQTAQPSYSNGGLWVNTTIQNFEFDTEIEPAGTISSTSYTGTVNQQGYGVYKGFFYYMNLQSSSSNPLVYKMDLLTGVSSAINRLTASSSYAGRLCTFFGKNDLLYGISYNVNPVLADVYSIAGNAWTATTERFGGTSSSKTHRIYSASESETVISYPIYNTSFYINRMSSAGGYITTVNFPQATNGIYFMSYNGTMGYFADYYNGPFAYSFSYSSKLFTKIADLGFKTTAGLTQIYSYGEFGGIVYFKIKLQPANMYGYSISSNSYSIVSTNLGTEQSLFGNRIWQNNIYMSNATIVSWMNITGNKTDANKVYVLPGGSMNPAKLLKTSKGDINIPIKGVYSIQSGLLKPITSYVSTGGAWKSIVY